VEVASHSAGWSVLRPAILAAMVGCIAVSVVTLLDAGGLVQSGAYLVPFCALTAVEAYASCRLVAARTRERRGHGAFRFSELTLLLVLLLAASALLGGNLPLEQGVPRFSPQTVVLAILVLVTWVVAGDVARILYLLDHPEVYDPNPAPPVRRLAARYFIGGLLVFVLAGLSQLSVQHTLGIYSAAGSGPLLQVVLYFLLGAILLAQLSYATRQRQWRDRGVSVAAGLSRRWMGYTMAVVVVVALLAFALPSSYSVGLTDLVTGVREAVVTVIVNIFTVIGTPLRWLLSLLATKPSTLPPRPLPTALPAHLPPHLPPLRHPGKSHGANWGGLLKSLIFWGAVLAALLYLLRGGLQRQARAGRFLRGLGSWGAIVRRWWATLWRRLHRYAASATEYLPLQRRAASTAVTGGERRGVGRWGARSTRERVIRYYLGMVQRANRHGFTRGAAQTPHEFEAVLTTRLSEGQADLHHLTDAFVEARYSRHPVTEEHAREAQASGQRIRAALRRLRKR